MNQLINLHRATEAEFSTKDPEVPQEERDAAKLDVDFDQVSTSVKVYGLMQVDRVKLQEKGNEYGECEVCQ